MWHGRVLHMMWACQSRESRPLKWPLSLVLVNWRLPRVWKISKILLQMRNLMRQIIHSAGGAVERTRAPHNTKCRPAQCPIASKHIWLTLTTAKYWLMNIVINGILTNRTTELLLLDLVVLAGMTPILIETRKARWHVSLTKLKRANKRTPLNWRELTRFKGWLKERYNRQYHRKGERARVNPPLQCHTY